MAKLALRPNFCEITSRGDKCPTWMSACVHLQEEQDAEQTNSDRCAGGSEFGAHLHDIRRKLAAAAFCVRPERERERERVLCGIRAWQMSISIYLILWEKGDDKKAFCAPCLTALKKPLYGLSPRRHNCMSSFTALPPAHIG